MTAQEAFRTATLRQQCEASEAMREARAMIQLQAASGRFEYVMSGKFILGDTDSIALRNDGYRVVHERGQSTISWNL